jgi:hypothetical protein|tara:strand:+ start:23 stop:511 length:489 start_codon:yes stop_codon:yes gene_type:complete
MASSVNLDISDVLNITCRKGDTFSITITLKDSGGTPLTLSSSGYVFLMQVKSTEATKRGGPVKSSLILGTPNASTKDQIRVKSDSSGPVVSNVATFSTPTVDDNGNVTIEASAEIMSKIPSGSYSYDLQYILPSDSGLDTHKTVLRGKFSVKADVTEAFESL